MTLIEIENMLQSNRRGLHKFKGMPYPDSYVTKHIGNILIYEELNYNVDTEKQNFKELFFALTGNLFSLYYVI